MDRSLALVVLALPRVCLLPSLIFYLGQLQDLNQQTTLKLSPERRSGFQVVYYEPTMLLCCTHSKCIDSTPICTGHHVLFTNRLRQCRSDFAIKFCNEQKLYSACY